MKTTSIVSQTPVGESAKKSEGRASSWYTMNLSVSCTKIFTRRWCTDKKSVVVYRSTPTHSSIHDTLWSLTRFFGGGCWTKVVGSPLYAQRLGSEISHASDQKQGWACVLALFFLPFLKMFSEASSSRAALYSTLSCMRYLIIDTNHCTMQTNHRQAQTHLSSSRVCKTVKKPVVRIIFCKMIHALIAMLIYSCVSLFLYFHCRRCHCDIWLFTQAIDASSKYIQKNLE